MTASRWAGDDFFRPLRIEVGQNVVNARSAMGLSRIELARAIDLKPATIGRIERGEGFPSLEALYAIARVTGTHPGVLLTVDAQGLRLLDLLGATTDALRR